MLVLRSEDLFAEPRTRLRRDRPVPRAARARPRLLRALQRGRRARGPDAASAGDPRRLLPSVQHAALRVPRSRLRVGSRTGDGRRQSADLDSMGRCRKTEGIRVMRSAKDFFRPLAVGAPDPVREIPARPSRVIHFFPPSNEKMVAKVADIAPTVDVLLANLEDARSGHRQGSGSSRAPEGRPSMGAPARRSSGRASTPSIRRGGSTTSWPR